MLGVVGVLASIALVIYLAFKGWSIIPASLLCSLVVILTNNADAVKLLHDIMDLYAAQV